MSKMYFFGKRNNFVDKYNKEFVLIFPNLRKTNFFQELSKMEKLK